MSDDFLDPTERIFGVVKARAATGEVESLRWVMDSARHWAVGEFARRMRHEDAEWREDEDRVNRRIQDFRGGTQVAVLYKSGLPPSECVEVGRAGKELTETFVRIQVADGSYLSAVCQVVDIFRLPPWWEISPWPLEFRSAASGMPEHKPPQLPPFRRPLTVKTPRADMSLTTSNRPVCPLCSGVNDPKKPQCGMCHGQGLFPLPAFGDIGLNDDDKAVVWDGGRWRVIAAVRDDNNGGQMWRSFDMEGGGAGIVVPYHQTAPPPVPNIPQGVPHGVH